MRRESDKRSVIVDVTDTYFTGDSLEDERRKGKGRKDEEAHTDSASGQREARLPALTSDVSLGTYRTG